MKSVTYIDDYKKWKEEFSFYTSIRVRFSETDMFGHVNNVSPFIYFEQARIEFLKEAGLFTDLNDANVTGIPIVADLQCDFHQQMFFDDEIKIYVKVNHIGTTSLDIHYMSVNGNNDVCLTGRGRMVYVHAKTGKPLPLSDQMKEQLERT